MKKLRHKFITKTAKSLPMAMLIAVVAFLGFGSSSTNSHVVPFAHADTPHMGDGDTGDDRGEGCSSGGSVGGSGGCEGCDGCCAGGCSAP